MSNLDTISEQSYSPERSDMEESTSEAPTINKTQGKAITKITADTDTKTGEFKAKPKHKYMMKEERRLHAFKSSIDKAAELKRPDWDGEHGRFYNLLPWQNQFAFNVTWDMLPLPLELEESVSEKPAKADREIQSSVICSILDDESEAKKFVKSGKKTTLAGTFVRIRVNVKDKTIYSIVDSGGSNASTARVKFFSRFNTEAKQLQCARSKLLKIKTEIAQIESDYQVKSEVYEKEMKEWQLRLAYWAYDNGFGIFPPELKDRS